MCPLSSSPASTKEAFELYEKMKMDLKEAVLSTSMYEELNLPHTDDITAQEAVDWLIKQKYYKQQNPIILKSAIWYITMFAD